MATFGDRIECRPDKAVMTLRGHEEWVTSVAFRPNGKELVSCSRDSTLRVWDARDGTLLEVEAPLSPDRGFALLAVPAGWLRVGRTVVEVRTTERAIQPVRRFVFEVE